MLLSHDTPHILKYVLILLKILIFSPICQIARVFSIIICIITIYYKILASCIAFLVKKSYHIALLGCVTIDKYICEFYTCVIIVVTLATFFAPTIAVMMFMGFSTTVMFNFISLKMYDIVPMPIFLFFPTFAIIIPTLAMVMIPMSIAVYEDTRELRNKWKYLLAISTDKGYVARKIRATKEIGIDVGFLAHNFFVCKKSTQYTFLEAMVCYTISALLSIEV